MTNGERRTPVNKRQVCERGLGQRAFEASSFDALAPKKKNIYEGYGTLELVR